MNLGVMALVISMVSAAAAVCSAVAAVRARHDAKEARLCADAAAAPQLTLTLDRGRRLLFVRNLGPRPAHRIQIRITDLNRPQREFETTRANLSPSPAGQSQLMTDVTPDQVHGSRARVTWIDHSGRQYQRTMLGNRDALDGYDWDDAG